MSVRNPTGFQIQFAARHRASLFAILVGGMLCTGNVAVAGHDGYFNPAIKRFTGIITAVNAPSPGAAVTSFRLEPLGPGMVPPAVNSLVGWRLVILNGKRWAQVFEVKSNTDKEVTIVAGDVQLDGIATKDVFLIEEPDPERPADAP